MPTTGLAEIMRLRFDHMRKRLVTAIGRLSPEDLAWRPNETSNSITNLALHVCGSLQQWLLQGVGQQQPPAARDRDSEFAERETRTPEQLVAVVESTFGAIDRLLATLPPERLDAPIPVRQDTLSGAAVLVRMVSHTGEHLGQILYIAKARMGDRFDSLSTPLRRPN